MKAMIKKIILFFIVNHLILSLAGCVAGLAVGGAALVYQRKNVQNYVSDKTIYWTINNRIYANKPLYANNHIVAAVEKGTVLLIGQAINSTYKQEAEAIVKKVDGIQRLYNEITIESPTSISRQAKDTALTTKVISVMLTKKNVNAAAIKVVTENSVVYLMGQITAQEADEAVNVVTSIEGVKKVVKAFQYITN